MISREDIDLVWSLVKASEAVGFHGAGLDSEETIEAFTEAFQERQELFGKVLRRMSDG